MSNMDEISARAPSKKISRGRFIFLSILIDKIDQVPVKRLLVHTKRVLDNKGKP
jgi:hypothetical protein